MAKPLGPKSLLIREVITAHPDKGNTELAELINGSDARKEDKIKVTANDVAQQRQAMKKASPTPAPAAASKSARSGPSKKRDGRRAAPPAQADTPKPAPARAGPVELIDRVFDLAQECGSIGALKRLVDRLAEAGGR